MVRLNSSLQRNLQRPNCGVEVTRAKVRREQYGPHQVKAPVSHIWYPKGIPSRMGLTLDMILVLEKVIILQKPCEVVILRIHH